MRGFTLIELLVSLAIASIISASMVIVINPVRRIQQARDVQRVTDIDAIMLALEIYESNNGLYPGEDTCDSSIGSGNPACASISPQSDWSPTSYIYQTLVGQGYLESLPIDPLNNINYNYEYEPRNYSESPPCTNDGSGLAKSCRYWIGAKLEIPDKSGNTVYRCSDDETRTQKPGCKMVPNWWN